MTNFYQIKQEAETSQINSYKFNEKKNKPQCQEQEKHLNEHPYDLLIWPIQCVAMLYLEPDSAASGPAGIW